MFKTDANHNKGFTLAEILIAVALLIVLIGISVPTIAKTYQDMEITKLDSQARIIYAAAQNRFMRFNTSGTIKDVVPNDSYDYKVGEVKEVNKLAMVPDDTGAEGGHASKPDQIIYISSRNAEDRSIINKLFPYGVLDANIMDSVNNDHAEMIIEYDPSCGSVYGVFYSESPIAYNEEYKNEINRSHDSRKAMAFGGSGDRAGQRVGYYGGDATHVDSPLFLPEVRVSFEEIEHTTGHPSGLYLKIDTTDASLESSKQEAIDISKWTYTIEMAQLDDKGEVIKDEDDNTRSVVFSYAQYAVTFGLDEGYYSYIDSGIKYILIDSLEKGYHFSDYFGDVIDTGANVKFILTIDQNVSEGGIAIGDDEFAGVGKPIEKIINPLYGSYTRVSKEDEDTLEVESATATISNARQLQNLNMDVSGVSTEYAPTHVVQTKNIDLGKGLEGISVSYAYDGPGASTDVKTYDAGKFVPIIDTELISYNGMGNTIYNMDAVVNSSERIVEFIKNHDFGGRGAEHYANAAGLFAIFYNKDETAVSEINGLSIVNPRVSTTGETLAGSKILKMGTLAGIMINTNVNNCQIYCDPESEGFTSLDDYGIFEEDSDAEYVQVGGFASYVVDCIINNCFVSIPNIISDVKTPPSDSSSIAWSAKKVAGGFAYDLITSRACVVDRSYANIGKVDGFTYSAGFVAIMDGLTAVNDWDEATGGTENASLHVESCYAAGNHYTKNAVGFVGFIDKGYTKDSYTVIGYGDNPDDTAGWKNAFSYGSFIGGSGVDTSSYINCYYLIEGEGIPVKWNTPIPAEEGEDKNGLPAAGSEYGEGEDGDGTPDGTDTPDGSDGDNSGNQGDNDGETPGEDPEEPQEDLGVYGGLLFRIKGEDEYLTFDGINGALYQDINALKLTEGGAGNFANSTANTTRPYSKTLGGTYPFPIINGLPHYGDWTLPFTGGII